VSRIHHRDGEWSLEVQYGYPVHSGLLSGSLTYSRSRPSFQLSMAVTPQEAQRLMTEPGPYRGTVLFSASWSCAAGTLDASGIELTEAEAERIRSGEHPRVVLFGTFPACGYRLYAVPDPLAGG
jgi:hypothetical protein